MDLHRLYPDATGLDLGVNTTTPISNHHLGTNLIWHFKGEEKGDKWEPEVFLYRGNGSTFKPGLAVNVMAGIILT